MITTNNPSKQFVSRRNKAKRQPCHKGRTAVRLFKRFFHATEPSIPPSVRFVGKRRESYPITSSAPCRAFFAVCEAELKSEICKSIKLFSSTPFFLREFIHKTLKTIFSSFLIRRIA